MWAMVDAAHSSQQPQGIPTMKTTTNTRSPVDAEKLLKKAKGSMIFGLKAWIKALEMSEAGSKKSTSKYVYEVSADAATGCIKLASDGSVVEGTLKSRDDWAAIGKPARLASIGLRSRKDDLEAELKERIEYTFNVMTGEAFLTRAGVVMADEPNGIAAWAAVGQPVEVRLFQQLNIAREYGNQTAFQVTRERMIKYGVIRKPPVDRSAAASDENDGEA